MNTSVYISAEQHVSVAKFVRDNARALAEPARRRAIQIHCCYAWNTLIDQRWKIMSIARRDWAAAGHSI